MDLFLPLRWLTASMLSMVVVVTLLQIALRYLFNAPLIWSEEFVRFVTVWMTFIGAVVVCYDGRHLNVDVFLQKAPGPIKRALHWFNAILSLAFLTILGWTSITLVKIDMMNDLSALPLTLGHLRLAVTVGSFLMIAALLLRIFYKRAPEYFPTPSAPSRPSSQDISEDME
ncbi:TRAP transporter small permease [uncultured Cohaesibacter sp.]|uniref:TRAP transporter small permease n=1 Tax=uncultured Cohaesibacter sp. TaxID=1002546 RepID=UPI0029C7EEDC|nr:TRAP transporter small permease [uncultured Cohaesibacter sp.]